MIDSKKLSLDDLKTMARAAEAYALEKNWAVTIAICDAGGHNLWLQRLDGAPAMSATIAPGKARASALSGKPSKALEETINGGRTAALNLPVLAMEGGEPIVIDGQVIGGIGVSGVLSAQDAEVAQAGIAALNLA